MRVIRLTVQYDGTEFVGWQRQPEGASIQGLLEAALARIESKPVTVIGAGRTDAGVHATGQVASVRLQHPLEVAALQRALNATLPRAVRVLDVREAPADFHARYGARTKTYRYRLVDAALCSPFERLYAWHVLGRLDVERMAAAAQRIRGTHDFAAFQSTGSDVATTVRTVQAVTVTRGPASPWPTVADGAGTPVEHEDLVVVEIAADGFLRHMVRSIVGSLVEIGAGRRDADAIGRALATHDRSLAGPTAPPHGLFLTRVGYGPA